MRILKYFAFLATALVALAACAPEAPESSDAGRLDAPEPMYAETTQIIDLVERAAEVVKSQGQEACTEFKMETGPWRQGDAYIFVNGTSGTFLCSVRIAQKLTLTSLNS